MIVDINSCCDEYRSALQSCCDKLSGSRETGGSKFLNC